jgi:hypothetical protein
MAQEIYQLLMTHKYCLKVVRLVSAEVKPDGGSGIWAWAHALVLVLVMLNLSSTMLKAQQSSASQMSNDDALRGRIHLLPVFDSTALRHGETQALAHMLSQSLSQSLSRWVVQEFLAAAAATDSALAVSGRDTMSRYQLQQHRAQKRVSLMPHDLKCSRYADALLVHVPGYGLVRVNIHDLCVNHDWDLWCATNITEVIAANCIFASAVGVRLAEVLVQLVPQRCTDDACRALLRALSVLAGGSVAVTIAAALAPAMQTAVAVAAARYPYLLYQGRQEHSCGCGGTTRTLHWKDGSVLCDSLTASTRMQTSSIKDGSVHPQDANGIRTTRLPHIVQPRFK